MNKLITICLSMIFLITLCSCGTQNESGENPVSSGQTATEGKNTAAASAESLSDDKQIQIEIIPPSGWEPVAGSVLPVQYINNTTSFMVKEESYFQSTTIDDVVVEAKAAFENTFDEVAYIGETESITVDGNDAIKILFTCKISDIQMKYEYVYLLIGGAIYAITFGGPSDTFDTLSADYEQILSDIRFR